jgi:hypothetical protein
MTYHIQFLGPGGPRNISLEAFEKRHLKNSSMKITHPKKKYAVTTIVFALR